MSIREICRFQTFRNPASAQANLDNQKVSFVAWICKHLLWKNTDQLSQSYFRDNIRYIQKHISSFYLVS